MDSAKATLINKPKSNRKKRINHANKPLVSIIIPIYNTEKYLKKCLNSIINQTYNNLEIICVNDGSTDSSTDILNTYVKQDSRIRIINQKNQGQSAARNHGLKNATGEYISFIDADDEVKPDFIYHLLQPFLKKPNTISISVCGMEYKRLKQKSSSNVYIKPLRSRHHKESIKAYILYLLAIDGRMYSSVNKLYQAKIAKNISFDINLNFAEDTKFVLDYLKKTHGEIVFIPKPLYIYNYGTETSTIKKTATSWKNWQTSYQNLKSWLGQTSNLRELFWLHTVYLRWRISYLRSIKRTKQ